MKLGRNDPCHCGSGKKYKKCHMAQDEAERLNRPIEALKDEAAGWLPAVEPGESSRASRRRGRASYRGRRKRFRDAVQEMELRKAYSAKSPEIVAALNALEPHWPAYEQLCEDTDRFLELADNVFSEEAFAGLHFTTEEVREACERAGFEDFESKDENVDRARTAILDLADEPRRLRMATALILKLPEYVSAGRFMEACLISSCATEMLEVKDDSNPFLFAMFSRGYEAMGEEDFQRNRRVIRELGLDPEKLPTMSVGELDKWLREERADPEKGERLAEILAEADPGQEQARRAMRQIERETEKLLLREDAGWILLEPGEVEPWLEEIATIFTDLGADGSPNPEDSDALERARFEFGERFFPLLLRMTDAVFTPARISALVAKLRQYAEELSRAGELKATHALMSGVLECENCVKPSQSWFLSEVCLHSVRQVSKLLAKDPASSGENPGPDTG